MMSEHQASACSSHTHPFNADPMGSGLTFPGPPEMVDGAKAPKDMGVSHDAQTPALNPNSDGIPAIPDLLARDNSSQPYPMQDPLLPLRVLQEHDAVWYKRYTDRVGGLEANLRLQSQQHHAEMVELFEKKSKEIREQSAEIIGLIVGFSSLDFF